MWLLALTGPTLVFLLALAALRSQRRRPAALTAPLALALTICFEAALLNVLSAFRAVARGPLLAAHGIVALIAAVLAARALRVGRRLWVPCRASEGPDVFASRALVMVLALPLAYSALLYRPNNWDSMTYHLARVAHWVQHRSVGAFDTNVARQVTLPPGAEYLLTVLQGVSGTDRLAGLVQLASWLVVVLAAAPLARIFGAPRTIAPWAALLFAAAPMAVLQASSTQNDLVAAAVAAAVVIACVPFLHRRARWRVLDLVIAAAVVSAGLLVKPTALAASAPFLLWAGVTGARALEQPRRARRTLAMALVPAVLVAAVLLTPELMRRAGASGYHEVEPFLYPPLSEGTDRALNVVRGMARHVPLPGAWADALAAPTTLGCTIPHSMCAHEAARANEDRAGNPASALLAAALLAAGIARWRTLPVRARVVVVALPGAWLLFSAVFRDNIWIARLHLPMFGLVPLAAAALSSMAAPYRWVRWAAPALGVLLVVQGARAAYRNELRPVPNPVGASFGLLPGTYYAARPEQWPNHVRAMTAIVKSGCKRLGLFIGGDSYDYPFTWRAMQHGIAVRHVVGPDAWPCVVYSDRGPPPSAPGLAWRPAGDPAVYVREAAGGGARSHEAGVARW